MAWVHPFLIMRYHTALTIVDHIQIHVECSRLMVDTGFCGENVQGRVQSRIHFGLDGVLCVLQILIVNRLTRCY